jgi:hypothetical protein
MNADARYETGKLLSEAWALTLANGQRVAITMLVLSVPAILIDIYAEEAVRMNSLLGLVTVFMQFWCTAGLLQDLHRRSPDAGGFGSVFVVGLLSSVAIIVGMVLLLIPGIILLVRWSMSIPLVVAEGGGATSAIGESWERTRDGFWPILGALVLAYLPALAAAVAVIAFIPLPKLVESVLDN